VALPGVRRRSAASDHPLVRLVTRLVVAQAVAGVAVGLPFSRRHLPSVLITLALFAAVCLLALVVRSGSRGAWLVALGFESAFFLFGLSRFVFARYVGGTLFALVVAVTLVHPAVARAYSVRGQRGGPPEGAVSAADAGETFGERAVG
jgi:ribose/xylose/arabinose/galactoside ABC-type transport system permease subunit